MEAPLFASHLSHGYWIGTKYHVEHCPICQQENTLSFETDGTWWCDGCKATARPIAEFKSRLANTDTIGKQLAETIRFEKPEEGLIVVSDYKSEKKKFRISTGFSKIDSLLRGLGDSSLTILTGKRGQGKSTFAGQLALNAIQDGHKVCFYSGELSARMFQSWIFAQAAGPEHMVAERDQFGNTDYYVEKYIEQRIRAWLGKKLLLYDNSVSKHSDKNAILERFAMARRVYGCDLFFVDNLMTAKYEIDNEQNYWRAQSNFAGALKDFAQENFCHIVLVAHPKKGDSGDINDNVSGSSDITNRADNVINVKKLDEKERTEKNADCSISITKNRDYGDESHIMYYFDRSCRQFIEQGGNKITKYGWADLC